MGGRLFARQVCGKPHLQGGNFHTADAGDFRPVLVPQLPQNPIVPEVHQPYLRLPFPVQRLTGKAGNALRCQRALSAGRQDHPGREFVVGLVQPPQSRPQIRVQRDHPVRQFQPVIQKGYLFPGQGGDFIPGQAGLPGQPQYDDFRADMSQSPPHGVFFRTVDHIFPHGDPPFCRL